MGGGYSLIWPVRRCAAGQGMVFCPLYSKQSVKFAPVDVCPKQGNNEQGVACTSGGSRKGARGAPLFLDQTEARRAEKNIFETGPPPPPS